MWGVFLCDTLKPKTLHAQVYYYNTLTNESTWEKPAGYRGDASRAAAQPAPASVTPVTGTEWAEVLCEDGRKYYFSAASKARDIVPCLRRAHAAPKQLCIAYFIRPRTVVTHV